MSSPDKQSHALYLANCAYYAISKPMILWAFDQIIYNSCNPTQKSYKEQNLAVSLYHFDDIILPLTNID